MSRSAADATRFTATGPYVGSKAPYKLPDHHHHGKPKQSPSSKTTNANRQEAQKDGPGGNQETPRQKVERLRAQARAARLSQDTSFADRVIERSRRAMNGAHKVVIYTLIAASGVCGVLTIYSAVSLTMWNRRQRELWLDRQLQDLQTAREAYVSGTASPEQLEMLRNEKIGEIEQQKIKEAQDQRLWNRTKRFLFDGMKTEDTKKVGVLEALEASKAEPVSSLSSSKAVETLEQKQGPLDVLAANAETSAKQSAKSWSDWIWRR